MKNIRKSANGSKKKLIVFLVGLKEIYQCKNAAIIMRLYTFLVRPGVLHTGMVSVSYEGYLSSGKSTKTGYKNGLWIWGLKL